MPGMLPVINEECVKQAVRTGLGLKAQINKRSIFDRKNYFYPDLPQGYQISQFKDPIVGEGKIVISVGPDRQGQFEDIEIGIERLHLEQDAGKSMHDQSPTMSYVDLNRSGVALMEIVSKPDMRSSDEAKAYVTKLRSIVRYLGTCDGNMDEGSMRADVNVSVRRPGGFRHALRDQERQLHPLHRPGDRIRGPPPDRHSRRWRLDRSGNPAVRPEQGRDPLDALQGRGA
jgi:aspartyl-tRNA(Asn)/glutamyl-tRNA(Gln) amidotransferase subunit B